MPRFVEYDQFGGTEVLQVRERDRPRPGEGEVLVRVLAAGLNPVDYKIFHGPAAANYNAVPPIGVGNDFAGVVEEVGEHATGFEAGDAVFGGHRNHALADYLVMPTDGVILPKPQALTFEKAGALDVAGRTAWAAVDGLDLTEDDTVFISAAAGGVGVLSCQLAIRCGATVVGTASEQNHEFLHELGVIPVAYGDDLVQRLRDAVPHPYTAALDNHGVESIDAALELGIPAERINSIAVFGEQARGASNRGRADSTVADLAHVAELVAAGELQVPIAAVFPLERVAEAYDRLEAGHVRGKVVVVTE